LFFINSVFIAVAYAVVINLLRVPHKTFVDKFVEQRVRRTLFAIVAITALPSLYLAYHLVRGEIFKNAARDFVQKEIRSSFVQVAKLDVDPKSKRIDVTLIGRALKRDDIDRIHDRLAQSKVAGSDLKLYQNGDSEFDVSALKNEIVQNLQINSLQLIQERDRRISELETELRKLNAESTENERFIRELTVQYPTLRNVSVGSALTLSNGPSGSLRSQNRLLVLGSSQRLSKDDRIRLSNWFRVRMEDQNAKVVFEE
jgi:SOS response regulatory protein OraA/RecX